MLQLRIIHCLVLFWLVAAPTLLPAEPEARLSDRDKQKIITRISKGLATRAFAWQVDFSTFPDQVARHRAAIDSAGSERSFAAAINAALGEFEVSHLRLYTPLEMAARQQGQQLGVGLKSVEVDGGRLVTLVLPDSPAAMVGLRKGDLLIKLDGQAIADGDGLEGKAGQHIQITALRNGISFDRQLRFADYRRALPPDLRWIDGDIAWLTLNSFARDQYDREQIDGLFGLLADARGLIIDLRGNAGGWSANVEHLAGHLLPVGTVLIGEVYRENVQRQLGHRPDHSMTLIDIAQAEGTLVHLPEEFATPYYPGPLVVLTDGRSGSGGDLFPAIVQDTGRGLIVGTRTAGKVLGGEWLKLPRGFRMLYPEGEVVRLNGTRLEGNGVTPDIELTARQTTNDPLIQGIALGAL